MGLEIDRDRFEAGEYIKFGERLNDCVLALETLLGRSDFGEGPATIGAELEVALIDKSARPIPLAIEVLRETLDPRMTLEIDRFNLECNLRYGPLAGEPFAALRRELEEAHAELSRAAALHGARIAMVGILPTVATRDLDRTAMTDTARYRALSFALREARQAPFRLDIDGQDPLAMDCDSVTFEGAATSLQIHLRVAPNDFAALFNAIQIATAPAIALAVNSPIFIGHRLWDETRVALFKQAVDERDLRARHSQRLSRVGFGTHWLRDGALELFREAVEIFPPLLPILDDEDPVDRLKAGAIPRLREMRLHQGTVWSWNRPVYDPADGGHLRIELRALPSGPTITDMLANTAFIVGLSYGLAPEIDELTERFEFANAHANFYRAAQSGLDAQLAWPDGAAGVAAPGDRIGAADLAIQLVEVARRGLRAQGVHATDADPLLEVVTARAQGGQTGAVWQRRMLESIGPGQPSEASLQLVVQRYVSLSNEGTPVHSWPVEQ